MKVLSEKEVTITVKESVKNWTLNLTDIIKNSNKFYNIEVIKSDKDEFYLYTNYGRVGGTSAKEYRLCSSQADAEMEAFKIIKSKMKKGYNEIKLVKTDVGSELGKAKIQASKISTDDFAKLGIVPTKVEPTTSSLHPQVQDLVRGWFGSIEDFIIESLDTSKCALGQLSVLQINKGREFLLEARKIINSNDVDIKSLNDITSKYYGNIPMNFGYKKLDADLLRFDNNDKLDHAFDILDGLENAKDVEKILNKKSGVDEKYKSLNTEINYLDINDPEWKWIENLFHGTKAKNHHYLNNLKVLNIFKLKRSSEFDNFIKTAEEYAKQNYKLSIPKIYNPLWSNRVKSNKDYEDLMEKSNILPLWHGTSTPNFPKILKTKLLMRKPGFTVSGSMFDKNGGLYFANNSTKSIGYSSIKNSIWSKGSDKKAYLFLSDVCLGSSKIIDRAYQHTVETINPHKSVWAQAGNQLINDEYIVYTENQNLLKYIIEFGV